MVELGYHPNLTARSLRSARTHDHRLPPAGRGRPLPRRPDDRPGDRRRRRHRPRPRLQRADPRRPAWAARQRPPQAGARVARRRCAALPVRPARPARLVSGACGRAERAHGGRSRRRRPAAACRCRSPLTTAPVRGALADHLITCGHTRIAFIAARQPWPMVEQRHAGYCEALHAAGLERDPSFELFEGIWDAADAGVMVDRLLALPNPPTAVMGGNDLLAIGVMRQARAARSARPRRPRRDRLQRLRIRRVRRPTADHGARPRATRWDARRRSF